ncbi:MAG: SUMF1/EgtB/PvdO family nonheme iron enzyme, partial [Desulfobacterales bacterium]|nr:SUMF1/EgtB/PvdO family nonheme iron enzyme [Desulfobacterales bacterium]
ISKYPVTNALFEIFVDRAGYKTTAEIKGFGTVYYGRFQKILDEKTGLYKSMWNSTYNKKNIKGACWYQPFGPGSNLHNKRNHPVVHVSLKDAIAFASWTGKRLPTEFEWEASARTQYGYIFPWGNEWKETSCNLEESAIADTSPVDYYPENTLGIADTLGNVLEWTMEECRPKYSQVTNLTYNVVKGGSFISDKSIRLYSRFYFETDFSANILSFRCIAD